MKYWRNFNIEFETINVSLSEKGYFDAIFIPTKSNKTKVEDLLNHLHEINITKAIFVIPTSIKDMPQICSDKAISLHKEYMFFLKEYYDIESVSWDLPLKRNFAILFSKQKSFKKILLLDDDIRFNNKSNVFSLFNTLENYWISGCNSIGEIDTSLIGTIANDNPKFFSGNCLGINLEQFIPFFPEIYNEDWLAILPAIINRKAILVGEVTQLTRIISNYQQMASFQEFGEIIVDDIYEHISFKENQYSHITDLIAKFCDLSHWEKVINDRKVWLDLLEGYKNERNFEDIIYAAKKSLAQITPKKCTDFLEIWSKQEAKWRVYVKKHNNMKEQIVDIKTFDGFILKGMLCVPDNIKAITIMCHGISSNKQEYLDMFSNLAQKLYAESIGSIRFDFRGHGESSGTSMDFDVISQLVDLKSVVCWLQKEKIFSELPINFVGVSFGGAAGILYHHLYKIFQRISLFAPVISYYETFIKPTTDWGIKNFNPEAWSKAKEKGYLLLNDNFKLNVRLLEEFLLFNPIEQLKQLTIPVQIFHGTADSFVPYNVVEKLSKECPNFNIRIIPFMEHGLYIGEDEDGISDDSKKTQEDYYESVKSFLS